MPSAPDGEPPLAFVIDFAEFMGAASVAVRSYLLGIRSGEVGCAAESVAASAVGCDFLAGDWTDVAHACAGRFGVWGAGECRCHLQRR